MACEQVQSWERSARRWRWLSMALALTLGSGLMLGQEDKQPEPPRTLARPARPVVQPSDSVEATALAIAYDVLREGGTEKLGARTIGAFAAEILNEFKEKRK